MQKPLIWAIAELPGTNRSQDITVGKFWKFCKREKNFVFLGFLRLKYYCKLFSVNFPLQNFPEILLNWKIFKIFLQNSSRAAHLSRFSLYIRYFIWFGRKLKEKSLHRRLQFFLRPRLKLRNYLLLCEISAFNSQ